MKKNKTAFIRELLNKNTDPKEIVARGKIAGMQISPILIYKVRSRDGKASKNGAGRKPVTSAGSASDFVRSVASDVPAKEVVAAGAKKGLKFSANLVYAVRAAKKTNGGNGHAKAIPIPVTAWQTGAERQVAQLRQLVLSLGFERTLSVVKDMERRFAEILGIA